MFFITGEGGQEIERGGVEVFPPQQKMGVAVFLAQINLSGYVACSSVQLGGRLHISWVTRGGGLNFSTGRERGFETWIKISDPPSW